MELSPEGTEVVPPPHDHLVAGLVKHLPYFWVEGCPELPKRRIPPSEVQAPELELWKVASHDWIQNDYNIKEVPDPLIMAAANIVYLYESTDVFQDELPYTVLIQCQGSIYK